MCFLIVAVIAGACITRNRRDENRERIYNGIMSFIAHHLEKKDIIGYSSSHKSYLFYGKALDMHVKYVPPGTVHPSDWLELLKSKRITVVAIGPQIERHPPPVRAWLRDAGGPFSHIFGRDFTREPELYRYREAP